ncbi:hypothetical protein Acor_55200 [Acrocarpospora corrugata]|uniref:Bacterial transcriptional activator domain-containing protein n=1 Tax=Acrocarpospora corrugata TaxID=35763 RepID=A0A5M3W3V2_9ACTN|nr:macro domain-containing protein [Acrocarpospora corrugata]GES03454.1 hypothetical protein Acor_55200 [Acrocarpospora corrugata]
MSRPYVRLLGPARVEIGGAETLLRPITAAVLARLIIAENEPVTVHEISHDVWGRIGTIQREDRTSVQKRILELRRILDPHGPGESSQVLRTERGRVSAYRLALQRDQVDLLQFQDLTLRAHQAVPASAVKLLTQALGLWRGRPLGDVDDRPFAAQIVRRLTDYHHAARRTLMYAYSDLELPDRALKVGEGLLRDLPDDQELVSFLAELRRQLRTKFGGEVFRQDFADLSTSLVVSRGDLFAQDDAHLVVGFTDTFDTATDQDLVISEHSVQGQLLRRIYGGDRAKLDRELKAALRSVTPAAAESRSVKRHGRLIRYPVGTVVALRHSGRRVFALAYSRMGNNLVAESSMEHLRLSLERLWDAVYLHGQRKPVALPLLGAGLARIDVGREELLSVILNSFLTRSRVQFVCPELRVVILPAELGKVDILFLGKLAGELDSGIG